MDKCRLIKPDISRAEDIRDFRSEMLQAGSSMDGTGPLARMENIEEWLEFNRMLENEDTVPAHLVPADQYIFVREYDNRIVGMIQIRRRFNEVLEKYGGNIGYSVRPSERRKGYAKQMLAACLPLCKAIGLDRVLVTCIEGNEGSRRTILANGGEYESTVYCEPDKVTLERYWIKL